MAWLWVQILSSLALFIYLFIYLFICLFRAAASAHGGSQDRGLTGAGAVGLHHSHSNAGSEPQLMAMLDP